MTPRQRAPRREPDLDAVLEAAVESLLANGERGFRIEHIIDRTGISRSSLYLHFTDRDGLVEAASLEIFIRAVTDNITRTCAVFDTLNSTDDVRRIAHDMLAEIESQAERVRWDRIMVLAASRYRETLYRRIREAQTGLTDMLTASVARWAELGMIKPGLEPRDIATFMQAITIGRVVRDLDDRPMPVDSWLRLMVEVHLAFLAD